VTRPPPGKLAVVDDSCRLTYGELTKMAGGIAANLLAAGVGPGDVVTSQLPNGAAALALCLAAVRVGAVHNPVLPSSGERELSFVRAQAGSALVVASADDAVFEPRPAVRVPAPPDGPRYLIYTSGSTAEPKGVLHTERTLLAECKAQSAYHRLGPDEVFVTASPVAHVSGLLYGELLPVSLGATTVLMASWDPSRFVSLIESERATFSGGATPFLHGLVDHAGEADISSLRVFPCGGADVPPELIRSALALGVRTGRGWGSTEFPSITSAAGPDDLDDKRALTDGRPIGSNRVRVAGDGELEAWGRELFVGYADPRLDADAFTDDRWFRTGDIGVVDRDGYVTLTGRKKDVVVRLGEKVSAAEVEALLRHHPAVDEVAVVAVPDPRTGERACAVVVLRGGVMPPSLEELTSFLVGQGLSSRKLPEQIEVVDTLPVSASGKVDKQVLRRRLTE